MLCAQEQIQIRISPGFPIVPATLPIRAPIVTHAVAHHLDRPRCPAAPHVENKFRATSGLGHFCTFDFRCARSRLIFHRVSQVNTTASVPTSRIAPPTNSPLGWGWLRSSPGPKALRETNRPSQQHQHDNHSRLFERFHQSRRVSVVPAVQVVT